MYRDAWTSTIWRNKSPTAGLISSGHYRGTLQETTDIVFRCPQVEESPVRMVRVTLSGCIVGFTHPCARMHKIRDATLVRATRGPSVLPAGRVAASLAASIKVCTTCVGVGQHNTSHNSLISCNQEKLSLIHTSAR